jgi:hypothetical protein
MPTKEMTATEASGAMGLMGARPALDEEDYRVFVEQVTADMAQTLKHAASDGTPVLLEQKDGSVEAKRWVKKDIVGDHRVTVVPESTLMRTMQQTRMELALLLDTMIPWGERGMVDIIPIIRQLVRAYGIEDPEDILAPLMRWKEEQAKRSKVGPPPMPGVPGSGGLPESPFQSPVAQDRGIEALVRAGLGGGVG